mmetsp:Transcript_47903/g.74805  ORF Transcript_47903/g.74805 Transcript_47903/m.74805 type:complete len:222 (+) Transcript_47903:125-790(+)
MPHTTVEHFEWVPNYVRPKGLLFWRLAITRFLLRLNTAFQESLHIDQMKQRIGWPTDGRVLGLHIRHGDSCKTNIRRDKCISAAQHAQEIKTIAARYKVDQVFVASDSPEAIEKVKSLAPELNFLHLTSDVRSRLNSGTGVYIEQRLDSRHCEKVDGGCLDSGDLLRFTMSDLLLLSETQGLVGHFTSNMSRLAFMLMILHHRRVVPFISVDGPWCFHWQV